MADDLRSELGCMGAPHVKSPHIDALAKSGRLFMRAYCQQAVCNPSRASMLTGLRPDTLRIWDLPTHLREQKPQVITLPQHFRNNGYFTQCIGKVFHNWRQEIQGDPQSWSVPQVMHYATHGSDKPRVKGDLPSNLSKTPKCDMRDVPDEAYFDGRIANLAVKALGELEQKKEPFFLAVGFWKPHLPFNAPKRYWDMYDSAKLPPLTNPERPANAPEIAFHDAREMLRSFKGKPPTCAQVRELRHGYYAATTYMDAQIGRVLAQLDRLGLRENTIITFASDHGFHLGEHKLWAKTSCFEWDAGVPMIITPPKLAKPGASTYALAELLDLYPTIVELAGLPKPRHLEGKSLLPVLKNPAAMVKKAAYTQHPRPAYYNGAPEAMGYSMRTADLRYTEWRNWKTGRIIARELYDHQKDPAENHNTATAQAGVVRQLSDRLSTQFPITKHR
ncbi:MAG: sulfatase [Verrucomicrobiota bacterium]|nr:sulfatase [Verrucomicrobiota bacterium]